MTISIFCILYFGSQVVIFQGRQDLAVSYNNDTQNFQTQTNFEHTHNPNKEVSFSQTNIHDEEQAHKGWNVFELLSPLSPPQWPMLSSEPSLLAPFIPCLDVELYILLAYQITFKSLQQPTGLPWEMGPSTCRSPSKHSSPSRSSPLHAFQLKCFYI